MNDYSSLYRELAPTGVLRASLNLANGTLAHSNTDSTLPAGVTVDLSRELARILGVPVEFLGWKTPGEALCSLAEGMSDVGFLAIDPKRGEQVHFTPPYVQIEACYLVREGSPLRHQEEVDRPGTEVIVLETSAYDLHLTRSLRHAKLLRVRAADALPSLFADAPGNRVLAGLRQALLEDVHNTAGLRFLPGHFMAVQQAMALPRSRSPRALAMLVEFLHQMTATGFISASLTRHRIEGATVLTV